MNDMPAAPGRDTRTRIVEAFTARLADQGYLGVSLDAVASDVGVRKASLYHHFPGGKEALFRAAGLAYVAHEEERVAAALAAAPDLEWRLIAVALLDAADDAPDPRVGQQVYDGTRHVSDEVRADVSGAYCRTLIDPVIDLVRTAVADGELVGDPELLGWSFLSLAQSVAPLPDDVAMPPGLRGERPDVRARAAAVVRLFLDGARAR